MIWHEEIPKINLYPWFVCELVRHNVKVCLSGNGGDEVFGGYFARYRHALRIDSLARSPLSPFLRGTGKILEGIPENIRVKNRFRALSSLGDNTSEYVILAGALPESFNEQLLPGTDRRHLQQLKGHYDKYFKNRDFLQGLINAELRTKLVDDLLSVDDTMSMAHSLEVRVPLLDNRIVDLMAPISWKLKYDGETHGKLLLRKAIREMLPQESLRKPKWGFSVNVYSWYKGELGEVVRQVLPDSAVMQKYFSESFIRKLLARPLSPDNRRLYVLLWQLLGFHFWHKMFIENTRKPNLELDELTQP